MDPEKQGKIEEEPKCTEETAETFKMDEEKTQQTTQETSEKDHAQNELIGDATDAVTNEKSMVSKVKISEEVQFF